MNNTQPSTSPAAASPATPQAPPQSDVINVPSLSDRAASVFGPDTPAEGETTEAGGAEAPKAPAEVADIEKRAADRKARLEALKAQERASVDAQQRHRATEQIQARLEAAERRAAEAERIASQRFDPESVNEEQFFDIARRARVTPQRLAEHIQERMANPELAAQYAAVQAVDPKLSALEKRLSDQQATIERFLAQQQYQAQAQEEAQATQEFMQYTAQSAAEAPHSAAFLREFGPKEFATIARSAAANVPPGAGWQAVLDVIEDNLSSMAKIYAPNGAQHQRPQASPKQVPAAAKAPTTVSNSLAQERASVVDEEANWAAMTLEERSARLFR